MNNKSSTSTISLRWGGIALQRRLLFVDDGVFVSPKCIGHFIRITFLTLCIVAWMSFSERLTDSMPHFVSRFPFLLYPHHRRDWSAASLSRCVFDTQLSHAFPTNMQIYWGLRGICVSRWWKSPAQPRMPDTDVWCFTPPPDAPLGGAVCPASVSPTRWQVPRVMREWRYGVLGADVTSGATAHRVCSEMDRVGAWAGVRRSPACLLPPQSCNHSAPRVTAPRSNWPVTLRALAGKGLAFVGLPWWLGHLMKTRTLWLMTSPSPSDILQMDNLLHHSHTPAPQHTNSGGAHLSVVKPHWTEDSFPFCLFSPWINMWQVNFRCIAKATIHSHLFSNNNSVI